MKNGRDKSSALRLGMFVVAALLIFSAGIFWIGSQELRFSRTYRLNAQFDNVTGLMEGAVVRVGGTHQGTVKRIDLPQRPDGKVTVEMSLKHATQDVIKKDSRAEIRSEGLVGDKYVEISFGTDNAEKIRNGDTIQSEPALDLSDLMKKANVILDSAQGTVQDLDVTASNLKSISTKVNQGSGTVGALINDKTVFQQATAGATAFREDMEAMKHNFLTSSFFHKRGYEDEADLKKHAVAQLPAGPQSRKFAYDAARLFDKPDNAKLKKASELNEAGKFLESSPFGTAVVAAYEDQKGDSEEDRKLTAARAMVVRDYLVKNYRVDDTRVKTIGFGKTAGIPDGGRVEILVYSSSGQPVGNLGTADRTVKK